MLAEFILQDVAKAGRLMRGIVYRSYGSPEVLQCEELLQPSPAEGEVLVRVHAAGVNPLDAGELKGIPPLFRTIFGIRKPGPAHAGRPGVDVAGTVEAIGQGVTKFQPGDEVFGVCVNNPLQSGLRVWVHDEGTFAEFAHIPAAGLVLKPKNLTFEQAAATPVAALTALQGLRDKGRIQPGQRVLIHGAGGGVGTFAVQIAKAFGAEVTAVTSTANLEFVRSLGADHVLDYLHTDFTAGAGRYDVILDCHATHPLSACRHVLNARGTYVAAGGPMEGNPVAIVARMVQMLVFSRFMARKTVTFLARPIQNDLVLLRDWMVLDKIKPVIDRCFPLAEACAALRHLSDGHPLGKVVITVP
jgi:NADPH:quinone reductase-like Zn-dependent oxidoreductase